MNNSTLVRGGVVFDGVSPRRARHDVRIVDGTIAEIGVDLPVGSSVVIDAGGLWVMPGFVDAHSHADAAVLTGEGMHARALAGVTTEIVGQDGLGLSFAVGAIRVSMAETLVPIAGRLPDDEFDDVAAYLQAIDRGSYARAATLVPHGTVRASVTGVDLRVASSAEIAKMRALIHRGMAQGAAGVSTGLSYAPALAASTDELVAVTEGLAPGTPYVTHLRDYAAGFDRAIAEAQEICRRSSLGLHLSHFHVSGPGRAGRGADYLADLAGSATWDTYPYTSGCTFLRALLPPEFAQLDGVVLASVAADPRTGAELAARLDAEGPGPTVAGGWETIRLAGIGLDGGALASWDSRIVADSAADAGLTSGALVVRTLALTQGKASIIVDHGHLDNVRALASAPGHLVGSDGIMGSGIPHPRATNAFFRFLAWAIDGSLAVTPEEMIARMTARTADRFALPVGRLVPGFPADLIIVDPAAIAPGPDTGYDEPAAVVCSMIAGRGVVADGRWRGDRLPHLALRATSRGTMNERTIAP